MGDDRTRVELGFNELMAFLVLEKPNDRSERDRAYAIVKTELEKAWAYYLIFCKEESNDSGTTSNRATSG